MTHKKNPDVFELIRAKCNKIKSLAYETDLVTSNLPSGYHRDYQVLKENLIPAFGEIQTCLHLAEKVILQVKVRKDILEAPAYKYITSVDRVNQMVGSGVPFRDAYQAVAQELKRSYYKRRFQHTNIEGYVFQVAPNREMTVLWGTTSAVNVSFPYTCLRRVYLLGGEEEIPDGSPWDLDGATDSRITVRINQNQASYIEPCH